MAQGLIPPDIIDEVRNRTSLVDVVRAHVPLRRKGRDFWGCCPFHQEKSPSFQVRDSVGYYHCFGCGAHGTAFDFVQQIQGLSFPDAVEYLASKAGVVIRREKANPVQQKRRLDGLTALESASSWFERNLNGSAKEYFFNRGLDEEIIKTFRLGFAPDDWRGLKSYLQTEGFNEKTILDTGLIRYSDKKSGEAYDTFRNRVIFPIQDMQGRPVAFGGRIMGEGEPKYLNSSETPFFSKSNILYGLYHAAPHIRRSTQAIIVEGYMDVIGLYQHGVKTAVAPMGTAITEQQVALLWKYHEEPLVCLDGDSAGRKAAIRLAQRVLKVLVPGKGLRFAWMPDGEDPDSFIAKQGREAFETLMLGAASLEDVLWDDMTTGHNLATGQGRATVEKAISDLAGQIENEIIRRHMSGAMKDRMWQIIRGGKKGKQTPKKEIYSHTDAGTTQQMLLALVVYKPSIIERICEPFAKIEFEQPRLKYLQEHIIKFLLPKGVDTSKWHNHLSDAGMQKDVVQLIKRYDIKKLLADKDITTDMQLEKFWLELYGDYQGLQSRKNATTTLLAQVGGDIATDLGAWQKFKAAKLNGVIVKEKQD